MSRAVAQCCCCLKGAGNTTPGPPLPSYLQVPAFRAALLRRGGWEELARRQAAQQLGPEAQRMQRARLERMLASIDLLCGMEQEQAGAAAAAAQQHASAALPPAAKLEAYRQVKPGVWEWWASYSLQLDTDRPAEAVTSGSSAGSSSNENQPRQPVSGGGGSGAAADGPAAKGRRWRLRPLPAGEQRALPADGKLCVLFGGHACEAALSLPASETRCAAFAWLLVPAGADWLSPASHEPSQHRPRLPAAGTRAAWRPRCG